MKLVFKLSKQNSKLSKAEVLNLFPNSDFTLLDNYLIIDIKYNNSQIQRLAYTQSVYKLLFFSKPKNLIDDIKNYDWSKIYEKNYCVRVKNSKVPEERIIADIIWNNLEKNKIKPKTRLNNPKIELHFIFTKTKVIAAQLVYRNHEKFSKRAPHKRPQLSPTSLDPRLARCMINLSKVDLGRTILDPFCGVGGILIEWGLIGGKIIGYDINNIELEKCKINLKHYKIKKSNYELINKDALTIKEHYDYIVTDLPYGRNSRITRHLKQLYYDFLKICKLRIKPKTLVIGAPDFVKFKNIINKSGYEIKYNFKIYIHKSLTKEVYVLE